jgi:hypothetical protein
MRPSSILATAVPVAAAILIAAYIEPPIPPLPMPRLAGSIQYRPVFLRAKSLEPPVSAQHASKREHILPARIAIPSLPPPPLPPPRRAVDMRPARVVVGGNVSKPERVAPEIATSEATAARPPRDAQLGTCEAYPVPRTYESMLSDVPKEKRKQWHARASLIIGKEGRISCIHFTQLTPDEKYNRKLIEDILGWKYEPAVFNGEKVEVSSEVDVNICF